MPNETLFKEILDLICDDVLPSYGVDAEVGRNDPELASAVRDALSAGNAEPVAWQYRWKIEGEWVNWRVSDASQKHPALDSLEERPLYTHPPALEPVKASPWRPIETAPKDGTRVIVRTPSFKWSSDICQHVAIGHRAVEARFCKGLSGEPGWRLWCGDEKTFSTDWIVAEAWMPLPPTPEAISK